MAKWIIVIGKNSFEKKPKRYMKKVDGEDISYHNLKEVVKTWQTKYGPYNTIKERGGSATFYNVGRAVKIEQIKEVCEVESGAVACGYNF